MVLVFLLLTILATQIITLGLLNRLSAFYVRSERLTVEQTLAAWTQQADAQIAGAAPPQGAAAEAITTVQSYLAGLPSPGYSLWLLDASLACTWSSLDDCQDQPFTTAVPGMAAVALGQPGPRCAPAFGGPASLWCAQAVTNPANGALVGVIVALDPGNGIYQTIPQIRTILFTWTIVAVAVMGVVSLVVARTITGPIGLLTRRARAMAAGDFAGRLPVRGHDEVGQLSAVFNHLGQRLQATLDEIRAEQRRAGAILTNMTDGIVAVGPQGLVSECNPRAAALLETDPGSVVGAPIADVLPPDVAQAIMAPLDQAPRRGSSGASPRVMAVPVRVGSRHLLAHIAPLTEGAATRGWVVVLHDVTEAERLEALRKEFVANVSHELRTPVTTIKLYAETLLEWGLDEQAQARAKVEIIAAETDRMHRLIQNLLVLSRLDGQRHDAPSRVPTDLRALAEEAGRRFEGSAAAKGLHLHVEPGEGAVIAGVDRDGLARVLANLLANAVDFTASGGRVVVRALRRPDGCPAVEVEDTGVGIPPAALDRIFERFYRVDASRSRQYGGSGLGLAIAQEIVVEHGGRIEVESEEGVGSRFRVILPPWTGGSA
jgi:two-component system sensor histidine kinase VicK